MQSRVSAVGIEFLQPAHEGAEDLRHVEAAVAPRHLAARDDGLDAADERVVARGLDGDARADEHGDVDVVVEDGREADAGGDELDAAAEERVAALVVEPGGEIGRGGVDAPDGLEDEQAQRVLGVGAVRRHAADGDVGDVVVAVDGDEQVAECVERLAASGRVRDVERKQVLVESAERVGSAVVGREQVVDRHHELDALRERLRPLRRDLLEARGASGVEGAAERGGAAQVVRDGLERDQHRLATGRRIALEGVPGAADEVAEPLVDQRPVVRDRVVGADLEAPRRVVVGGEGRLVVAPFARERDDGVGRQMGGGGAAPELAAHARVERQVGEGVGARARDAEAFGHAAARMVEQIVAAEEREHRFAAPAAAGGVAGFRPRVHGIIPFSSSMASAQCASGASCPPSGISL